MNKLKILILNWRDVHHPDAGGAETHLHEIASRWVNLGHDVTLYCSRFPGGKKEDTIDGVKIIRAANKYFIYPAAMKYIFGSRRRICCDVILESINTMPFFSPLLTSTPVVAQIYSIDNRTVLQDELGKSMLPIATGLYAIASTIPKVYRNCEVTTISKASKNRLIDEGFIPDRIHVAYPGLSETFRKMLEEVADVQRPGVTIVYLGRLKKYKGIDDIIKALPYIKGEIPSVKLLIIGKGDYEQPLKNLTNTLGLEGNVDFCGFVSEREKATLLKSASLYICTSKDEGGWTIAAVEAMAAGVPILVTASQLDVVKDGLNGFLLSSNEPRQIANRAISTLSDKTLWQTLSRNALDFSQRFNWDTTSKDTLDALEKAVSRNQLMS